MPGLDYYLNLIPSQHRDKPRFMAVAEIWIEHDVEMQRFFHEMPFEFDLDTAVGVQLDQVGEWIGRTRHLHVPLEGVYFAWATTNVGWGEGSWKGTFDPETKMYSLPDDVYRRLLRAKIAANHWDGTIPGAYAVWDIAFKDSGFILFIDDHQDMSMSIFILGKQPDIVTKSLVRHGYLPLKPEGVRIGGYYTVTNGEAIFSWGCDNDILKGWGAGNWPINLDDESFYVVEVTNTAFLERKDNDDVVLKSSIPAGAESAYFARTDEGGVIVKNDVEANSRHQNIRTDENGNIILLD